MDRQLHFKYSLILVLLTTLFIAVHAPSALANETTFLPPEKAFAMKVDFKKNTGFTLSFSIAPNYLLYQKHFEFRTLEGTLIPYDHKNLPPALKKHDDFLGEYEVYANQLTLNVPIASINEKKEGFRVQYQGCTEAGFCYLPIAKQITLSSSGTLNITDISTKAFQQKMLPVQAAFPSVTDNISEKFKQGSLPLTLVFFLGLGLLLAFTPCVFPMIPIMANILMGKNPRSHRRSLLLAALYVFSMALCYAIAGVIAGLMGNQFQSTLQQPVFLILLSLLLIFFALNQFDLIHMQLPERFTRPLDRLRNKQKKGSIMGVVIMGILSALIMSPCVTPAFVGALTYIGQTGNALLGGLALFTLALGMGLPLLGIACVGSRFLPKSGSWMKYIQWITGVLLLILAASILLRAFPAAKVSEQIVPVHNLQELNHALTLAKTQKGPILLNVHADWCISCRKIDHYLSQNQTIRSALQETTLLRLDVTKQSPENSLLQRKLKILGPPTFLFFDANGEELRQYRLVGDIDPADFTDHLNNFLKTLNNPEKE